MLTELTGILAAALPVQALKDHLRLGTGFSDDAMQDQLLESYLRAAIGAIEGRIGKVILQRSFRLSLQYWRSGDEQPLPLAPVTAISAVRLIDLAGGGDGPGRRALSSGRGSAAPQAGRGWDFLAHASLWRQCRGRFRRGFRA